LGLQSRVVQLPEARNDLVVIRDFHPQKGKEIVKEILDNNKRLEASPKLAAHLSYIIKLETDYRYFLTGTYLSLYKLHGKDVIVYRIFDGRQDWLNTLGL